MTRNGKIGFLLLFVFATSVRAGKLEPPADFWGFEPGSDYRILRWSLIIEYFKHLEENTDRIRITELGRSTEDKPLILATISSPLNLANLAKFRNLQNQATNPAHLSENDVQRLCKDHKAFVLLLMNNYTQSVATSYASVDLAYQLATRKDKEILSILENSIIFMIPSVNPDGLKITENWYSRYVGSEFEAAPLPWAPHKYTGAGLEHDWEALILRETQVIMRHITTWPPVAVISSAARYGSPTYIESVSSGFRLSDLESSKQWIEKEIEGMADDCRKSDDCRHSTLHYHHALVTNLAVNDVKIATPVYYPEGSSLIDGSAQETPGWLRLKAIIDKQNDATLDVLGALSENKVRLLEKYIEANRDEQLSQNTYLVLPASQRDSGILYKVLRTLLAHDIKIEQAINSVESENGRVIDSGDYLVNASQVRAQSLAGIISVDSVPVNGGNHNFVQGHDKDPHNLLAMFGIDHFLSAPDGELETRPFEKLNYPPGTFKKESEGNYYFSLDYNNAYLAINRLIEAGKDVYILQQPAKAGNREMPAGTVFIRKNELKSEAVEIMARGLSLNVLESNDFPQEIESLKLKKYRLAVHSPWYDNQDEGWIRFVLDDFEFRYERIHNSSIKRGKLDFDVVMIPDIEASDWIDGRWSRERKLYEAGIPEQYTGGIGEEGIEALKDFTEKGGTLVVLNRACIPLIRRFGLPFEIVDEKGKNEAALSQIKIDQTESVAFGQPEVSDVLVLNSPVLKPIAWTDKTSVIAMFAGENQQFPNTTAVAELPMGRGRIILMSFHPMYRAQTPASFKFIFNAILSSKAEKVILE